MPHATHNSSAPDPKGSSDSLGRMNQSNAAMFNNLGKAEAASSSSKIKSPSQQPDGPVKNPVVRECGTRQRGHVDDYSYKHLGNRNSMIADYNNTSNSSHRRKQSNGTRIRYRDDEHRSLSSERTIQHAPVLAELRTNVIVKDEFALVTGLSNHLATTYSRPESAVMVRLDHSACLALGGTFDPCYILTLTAAPAHLGANPNRRHAVLIQAFMAVVLRVPSDRGIVKFAAVSEENLAINGTTVLRQMQRLAKQSLSEGGKSARKAVQISSRRSESESAPGTEPTAPSAEAETPTENERASVSRPERIEEDSLEAATPPDQPTVVLSAPEDVFELPTVEMHPVASVTPPHTVSPDTDPSDDAAAAAAPPPPSIRRSSPLPPSSSSSSPAKLRTRRQPPHFSTSSPLLLSRTGTPSPSPTDLSASKKKFVSLDDRVASSSSAQTGLQSASSPQQQQQQQQHSPAPTADARETASPRSHALGKRRSFLAAWRRSGAVA